MHGAPSDFDDTPTLDFSLNQSNVDEDLIHGSYQLFRVLLAVISNRRLIIKGSVSELIIIFRMEISRVSFFFCQVGIL